MDYPSYVRPALVAHGKITYRDVFGISRETDYRYYVGGNEAIGDKVGREPSERNADDCNSRIFRMRAHSDGNDAT